MESKKCGRRNIDIQIHRWIDRQIDRWIGRQINRQIDEQIDRQIYRIKWRGTDMTTYQPTVTILHFSSILLGSCEGELSEITSSHFCCMQPSRFGCLPLIFLSLFSPSFFYASLMSIFIPLLLFVWILFSDSFLCASKLFPQHPHFLFET